MYIYETVIFDFEGILSDIEGEKFFYESSQQFDDAKSMLVNLKKEGDTLYGWIL